MDRSDLVGSKKNKGIYSQQLLNLKRKQQVDSILGNETENDENLVKYQDKLLCKLCNTLHTNIISYQRHIRGKKHATKVKIKEKKLAKQIEKETAKDQSKTTNSSSLSSQIDIERDNYIKKYTNNLLQKYKIKNKTTQFYNIGSILPQENISTEFTIDNSSTTENSNNTNDDEDQDTIGLLIRLKLDLDKNESKHFYKKYLSKEELATNDIDFKNDVLLLYLPEYKPIIIKIPEKMSLIGGEDGMGDCKVDDCWYLQLSLLIRS
ncbi:hypothetical protein ACO0SA_000550 [Hanseniaspora valbyensis]